MLSSPEAYISQKKLNLLALFLGALILSVIIFESRLSAKTTQEKDHWSTTYYEILRKIKAPQFPDIDFNVKKYGAVNDGKTDCKPAFNKAIAACSKAGGGRVVVPEGTYFHKGPIHFKDNVNLHVKAGARIKFSTDPNDFLPVVRTRQEGTEFYNYSPMLYAYKKKNIAITGSGTIDACASKKNWWTWREKGKKSKNGEMSYKALLMHENNTGVPLEKRVYGSKREGLRPVMLQFFECNNILLEGVTIRNSPMWHLNPVLCSNITVRDLTIEGSGPNNDGCNPDSSQYVLIEHCKFKTGDDCIAIKSGKNRDGWKTKPSENIIIRSNFMKKGHGGIVIGSEMSGGVRWVFAHDNKMDSKKLKRGLRFKSNTDRGGIIENIYIKNTVIENLKKRTGLVIVINQNYGTPKIGKSPPVFRKFRIENLTYENGCEYGFFIDGLDQLKVKDIMLKNIKINGVKEKLFIRNVENIVMDNVYINGEKITVDIKKWENEAKKKKKK